MLCADADGVCATHTESAGNFVSALGISFDGKLSKNISKMFSGVRKIAVNVNSRNILSRNMSLRNMVELNYKVAT